MLFTGHVLLERQGDVRLVRGWVGVEGGKVVEVGEGEVIPARWSEMARFGDDDTVISPGFADAHVHIPQFDSIGADGLPLLDWLERVIFPAEMKWSDPEYARHMGQRVAQRLLDVGTTAVAAYGSVHHAGSIAAMRALAESGIAGHFGQVLMDPTPHTPPELARPASQLLAEAARLEPIERLRPAVTPRFAVSCSPELLEGAGRLAREKDWYIQTHLSETQDECEIVRQMHGADYVEVYRRAGLLGPRTLLGHGIWLSDAERQTLASTQSLIAHCPTANLFLEAGRMDLAAHERAGIRIALGSDVAGGPDVCMVRVARAMIETAKQHRLSGRTDVRIPRAAEAWWHITAGNARALGLNSGRFEPGMDADLVAFRPRDSAWRTSPDPLAALLYGWDEQWIQCTMVAGRLVACS